MQPGLFLAAAVLTFAGLKMGLSEQTGRVVLSNSRDSGDRVLGEISFSQNAKSAFFDVNVARECAHGEATAQSFRVILNRDEIVYESEPSRGICGERITHSLPESPGIYTLEHVYGVAAQLGESRGEEDTPAEVFSHRALIRIERDGAITAVSQEETPLHLAYEEN